MTTPDPGITAQEFNAVSDFDNYVDVLTLATYADPDIVSDEGDGYLDIDSTGDGVIDTYIADTDGDGTMDRIDLDQNDDGVADLALLDTDADGATDTVLAGGNESTYAQVLVDEDQDGTLDTLSVDGDLDGETDTNYTYDSVSDEWVEDESTSADTTADAGA